MAVRIISSTEALALRDTDAIFLDVRSVGNATDAGWPRSGGPVATCAEPGRGHRDLAR